MAEVGLWVGRPEFPQWSLFAEIRVDSTVAIATGFHLLPRLLIAVSIGRSRPLRDPSIQLPESYCLVNGTVVS